LFNVLFNIFKKVKKKKIILKILKIFKLIINKKFINQIKNENLIKTLLKIIINI
jgi:hypothetical protein